VVGSFSSIDAGSFVMELSSRGVVQPVRRL